MTRHEERTVSLTHEWTTP